MILMGIASIILFENIFFTQIFLVIGLELIVLSLVSKYVLKSASLKVLGIVIIVFSTLNFFRHSVFLIVLSRIFELYEGDSDFTTFLMRGFDWLLGALWIAYIGLKLVFDPPEVTFDTYVKSSQFQALAVIIIVLLILEIPVFGIHGDFGGRLHGHSYWDAGMHMH